MDVKPPNCPQFSLQWIKTCGGDFKPHPGLMIDMDTKTARGISQTLRIVEDGLIMYPHPKQNDKIFDIISKHFKIYSDQIKLSIFCELTPHLLNIFRLESGINKPLYDDFVRSAAKYTIGNPYLEFDEEIGKIIKNGQFKFGGTVSTGVKGNLELEMKCSTQEDLFVNLVLPLASKQSVSIVFQRICKGAHITGNGATEVRSKKKPNLETLLSNGSGEVKKGKFRENAKFLNFLNF